jgi:hypothetical protein
LPRLAEECEGYLVVAKNLGADSLLAWIQETFADLASERVETAKSFRVFRVAKA